MANAPFDLTAVAGRHDDALAAFLNWTADGGLSLYPAQEEALLEVFSGAHVIVNTPTGSGKSLIALGAHIAALSSGRRSFYTAPVKALVSEKFFALCGDLGAENVGMLTGDASINPSAPVVCATAEIVANMALRGGEVTPIDQVVMDEFHFYGDPDRGWAWQVPLLELTGLNSFSCPRLSATREPSRTGSLVGPGELWRSSDRRYARYHCASSTAVHLSTRRSSRSSRPIRHLCTSSTSPRHRSSPMPKRSLQPR